MCAYDLSSTVSLNMNYVEWGRPLLTATGNGFSIRAQHEERIGQEQSHISVESREMLTTAALLLSENSALSTTLMCHMMLLSEKCHCPLSTRRDDCMSFMVPQGVWVWFYNSRVFFVFDSTCLGVGLVVLMCLHVVLHVNHLLYGISASINVTWWRVIYNFLFIV